jgi:hypothetical protein
LEQHRREPFGNKDVGELTRAQNLLHMKLANGDLFPHEVYVNLYVFGAVVVNPIARHIHTRDVVAVCHGGLGNVAV